MGLSKWLSVKELSAKQQVQVGSLDRENPLKNEMATHSSIAWEISWTEEPGGLHSIRSKRVRHNLVTEHNNLYSCTHIYLYLYLHTYACMLSHSSHVPLCDPTDCSPPGSSGCGILQARILEWVAISYFSMYI